MKNSLTLTLFLLSSLISFAQITITSVTSNPTSCSNNGSVTITISGGSPVFCYRINGSACQFSGDRTHTFSGLFSGSYTITVEDAQSSQSQTTTVGGNYTEPTAWTTVNGCALLANASGGLPPYLSLIHI